MLEMNSDIFVSKIKIVAVYLHIILSNNSFFNFKKYHIKIILIEL